MSADAKSSKNINKMVSAGEDKPNEVGQEVKSTGSASAVDDKKVKSVTNTDKTKDAPTNNDKTTPTKPLESDNDAAEDKSDASDKEATNNDVDGGGDADGDANADGVEVNDDDDDDDVDNVKKNSKIPDKKKDIAPNKQPKEDAVKENGIPLEDIVKINTFINNTKSDGLQTFHMICFDNCGKVTSIKRNLRKFKGFKFDKKSDEYKKKLESVEKIELNKLKTLCDVIGLDKKGTKEELAKRICEFLLAPEGEDEDIADDDQEQENEDDQDAAAEEGEEEEEEEEDPPSSEEDKKRKKSSRRNAKHEKVQKTSSGRPRRATAGKPKETTYVDYGTSEEESTYEKPKGSKRKRDESDTGSDYNPSGISDSDGGRKKWAANISGGGRGRSRTRRTNRRKLSESEEEEDEEEETPNTSEDDSDAPKNKNNKKRAIVVTSRGRGRPAAGRGGGKKVSESEPSEVESEDDSRKKPSSVKNNKSKNSTPSKGSPAAKSGVGAGRPKRATAAKSKSTKDETSEEEEEELEEDEDEEEEAVEEEEPEAAATAATGTAAVPDKDEGSEDEPLSKKAKSSPPTDSDIKMYVKTILDDANLEEITMKTVCKQVYAKFPQHDLSHKKDFIKSTVKALIAAT